MIEAQLKELEECMRVLCIDREDWLAYLLKGKGLTIKAVKQAKSLSTQPRFPFSRRACRIHKNPRYSPAACASQNSRRKIPDNRR